MLLFLIVRVSGSITSEKGKNISKTRAKFQDFWMGRFIKKVRKINFHVKLRFTRTILLQNNRDFQILDTEQ